jgi:hypothetical protein
MIDLVTTPAEKDISVKFCKKNSVTFLIARGIMTKTDPHISFPATQQQQQQQKEASKEIIQLLSTSYLILLRAVLVTTSAPCSKRSGMRFANRNMFKPCN